MKKITTLLIIALAVLSCANAYAYNFWGVNVGTEYYDGATQLTFDGLGDSSIQYAVGGWKYTKVDNQWLGAFDAPIPGEGWLASRRSDAQGIFFKADANAAKFMVVTTASQTGQLATELGYDQRRFGPGDLKIDVKGKTYGVGMRISSLLWAEDYYSQAAQYQLYGADGSILNMRSRDTGTVGEVEENPLWARAGNQSLASDSDKRFAFYVKGTGSEVGSASVAFSYTGLQMNGARVYAYEVTVPWQTIGLTGISDDFTASWRPDCGNDVITAKFSTTGANATIPQAVPEPGSIITLAAGILGCAAKIRK